MAGRRVAPPSALLLVLLLLLGPELSGANQQSLCLEDDYTNELPIFIEKRTICNYETVPVSIYSIKVSQDGPNDTFCLKGQLVGQLAGQTGKLLN